MFEETVLDLPLLRYYVLSLHGEQITIRNDLAMVNLRGFLETYFIITGVLQHNQRSTKVSCSK